ncbi:MAG: CaiB/BaiF CoA-transferase family protein [Candidatus Dormibacteraceae bacterium]
MPKGPLDGVRVLDFSRVVSGPAATLVLSDLGAEVIKIERPGTGDDTRDYGPPFLEGISTYFAGLNRGKKSVVIDLGEEHGREIAANLAVQSDVLVENFRPGFMERIGLGYERLKARHPGLIYCSITGFGSEGPYRDRAGYDVNVAALGGMLSITGEPGGAPVKTGVPVLDVATGLYAFGGIAVALYERERTGLGKRVEVSMLEVQVSTLITAASAYLLAGDVLGPHGTAHPAIVPYQAFKASDGWVVIGALNSAMFERLTDALGHPEWATDERFANNRSRVAHREALVGLIDSEICRLGIDVWVELLGAAGVAVAPVNTIDRVFTDPHVSASGIVKELDDPRLGRIRAVTTPLRFDGILPELSGPVPLLGESNLEVLGSQ